MGNPHAKKGLKSLFRLAVSDYSTALNISHLMQPHISEALLPQVKQALTAKNNNVYRLAFIILLKYLQKNPQEIPNYFLHFLNIRTLSSPELILQCQQTAMNMTTDQIKELIPQLIGALNSEVEGVPFLSGLLLHKYLVAQPAEIPKYFGEFLKSRNLIDPEIRKLAGELAARMALNQLLDFLPKSMQWPASLGEKLNQINKEAMKLISGQAGSALDNAAYQKFIDTYIKFFLPKK